MSRKLKHKKRLFFLLLVLFLALAGSVAALASQLGLLLPAGAGGNGSFSVLLLGTDARPGDKGWGTGRTDSIIVANLNVSKGRLALLSIPRDSRVNIPGHGFNKINAAIEYGGPELTAQVVSGLIGMPVHYYALVDWNGFKDIVNTLGGVTVNVQRNMYHYDSCDGPQYTINLHKGTQHLDGKQALEFVRFRDGPLGDIGRTRRQQEFLQALVQQAMRPGTLFKLPVLVPEIRKCVQTNLGLWKMLTLAGVGGKLKQMQTVTQTLPGQFLTIDGISYWGVDPQQARQVAHNLFQSGLLASQVVEPAPAYALAPGNMVVRSNPVSNNRQVLAQRKAALPQVVPQEKTSSNQPEPGGVTGGGKAAISGVKSPAASSYGGGSKSVSKGTMGKPGGVSVGGSETVKTGGSLPDPASKSTGPPGGRHPGVEIVPLPVGNSS